MVDLHTKTMNHLQAALLEHDSIIQYKKGAIIPADYLSCLPSTYEHKLTEITKALTLFNQNCWTYKRQIPISKRCTIS
jgi:hypothetical protein